MPEWTAAGAGWGGPSAGGGHRPHARRRRVSIRFAGTVAHAAGSRCRETAWRRTDRGMRLRGMPEPRRRMAIVSARRLRRVALAWTDLPAISRRTAVGGPWTVRAQARLPGRLDERRHGSPADRSRCAAAPLRLRDERRATSDERRATSDERRATMRRTEPRIPGRRSVLPRHRTALGLRYTGTSYPITTPSIAAPGRLRQCAEAAVTVASVSRDQSRVVTGRGQS